MDTRSKRPRHATDGHNDDSEGGVTASSTENNSMMAEMIWLLEKKCSEMMAKVQDEMNEMKSRHESEIESLKQRVSRVDELERKCRYLEERCDSLGRSVDILKKEEGARDYEYPVPIRTLNDWMDHFDEDIGDGINRAQMMFTFLDDFPARAANMRRGKYGHNIIFDSGRRRETLPDEGDGHMLAHWDEMADAIQLCHHFNGSGALDILSVELKTPVMYLLARSLKTKKFRSFTLERNNFASSSEGVDFAIQIACNNPSLKKFGWIDNTFENMDDFNDLLENISGHPPLETVQFKGCCGENVNGYDVLQLLLSRNLKFSSIDLGSNDILTAGRTDLPDFIATNAPLRSLILENNHLDDNDAMLIAEALKHNTNLRDLYLDQNDIMGPGFMSLHAAICGSSDLNSVANANHTCYIDLVEEMNGIVGNASPDQPRRNRADKIYRLLSFRNMRGCNVQLLNYEFGDDYLKLAPKVLECVHLYRTALYEEVVPPLSIMYEILRGWKMPELYEKRQGLSDKK